MKKPAKLLLCFGLPLLVLVLPLSAIPINGLTLIEHRLIAIFLFAALSWMLEPIPIYSTSVMVILLELLMLSDKSLIWLQGSGESFGQVLNHKAIMGTFASPIIMLFLGGFFLAMAATKYRLDINLARVLLKPCGDKPRNLMLGLMLITAVFSMFMSNTATTAMMLSILAPVLTLFDARDKGRIGFALCIPVAANIGGIGTPIGTPPNAIALKYLTGENSISFEQWMAFGVPFAMVMLLFAWLLLSFMFPAEKQSLKLEIRSNFLKTPAAITVYFTFTLTILLWLMGSLHGMNSYVVALIPVAIFSITSIITKEDLKRISWDVLWLVAGGFALGLALDQTGLAAHTVNAIPFGQFSPYVVLVGAAVICLLMANFMSNTATANLLLPIMAALATSMQSLIPLGGAKALIICVTFAASLGMSLPISTPPNALAHASGHINTSDMAKVGVSIGIVGLLLCFALVALLRLVNFV